MAKAKTQEFWVEPAALTNLNFAPATLIEEVYQNVNDICSVFKGEVLLDRDFGIDPNIIDSPMTETQQRLVAGVVANVERLEPRIKVKRIQIVNIGVAEAAAGTLAVRVKIRIKDEYWKETR